MWKIVLIFAVRSLWTFWGLFSFLWDARTAMWRIFLTTAVWPAHCKSQGEAQGRDGNSSSSAGKSHGSQTAWGPSKALPSSSPPGVAICQVCRNKLVLIKQQQFYDTRGEMYSLHLAALQKNSSCLLYNSWGFFAFFFTFKIKNLPKKAYKVYGRGIQEAN